ncbi:hypothetical protein DICPUDRAFT_75815 [Dictyostelium purpureum]|uniref:Acyl-CoA dehydrogenase n=1 Tax=Dictyostelium purpureum TaxID=5786 RepID=F0ZBR2_DICPU|nr:uncharacterized protein DICPUDRAFT_75815 [Dictyostelium purpureum]EGC38663.1 hypothetical protein DICPUDRAFT_75815 [Dictyostelium purpureum]|eukprot:XP_003284856.1 hypothetical protein DICPUDRAFT_75815 [Dictyostelium purpureum]
MESNKKDICITAEYIIEECNKLEQRLRNTDEYISPLRWRKEGSKFGLTGIDLPLSFGGSDFKVLDVIKIYEHMGKFNLNFRDVIGGAHVRSLLATKESDQSEHSKKVVEMVVQGEAYVGIVITEPTSGSDFQAMKSKSVKNENGDFILNGEKRFNARLKQATHIILYVLNEDGPSINVFLVPINHKGLEIKSFNAQGLLGNSFGGVSFKDMHVPKEYLIGNQGDGVAIFHKHFLYWRLMQSAAAIGTGKCALDQAASRMLSRDAFGGPIGRFTHLQQDLAQHTAKLYMGSLLVEKIATMFDEGASFKEISKYVPMAKAECIEFALSACDWSMEIHGADGYSTSFTDLGQRVNDLQGLRIADGTTSVMRSQVVRTFYDDRFWKWAVDKSNKKQEGHPDIALRSIPNKNNNLAFIDNYLALVDDKAGGPCVPVLLVNTIQVILNMFKRPLINIDKALEETFQNITELSKGRLSNLEVIQLFHFLVYKYLEDIQFDSRVDYNEFLLNLCMDTFKREDKKPDTIEDGSCPYISKKWNDLDSGLLLTPQPYQIKIISFNVWDKSDELLGRHFILLIDRKDDTITSLDSNRQAIDSVFKLSRIDLENDDNNGSSIDMKGPNPNGDRMIINSVFTFSFKTNSKCK